MSKLDLTLDHIHNPKINEFYGIFMHVSTVITSFLYVTMLVVIIRKSNKDMGLFRNIVGTQITFSYAFDLALNSFQLVPLMPFYVSFRDFLDFFEFL